MSQQWRCCAFCLDAAAHYCQRSRRCRCLSFLSKQCEENNKLARTLKLKQAERQKLEYPAIRSRYGQMTAAAMWEYDQEIKIYGNGNSTISFTHASFGEKETIERCRYSNYR